MDFYNNSLIKNYLIVITLTLTSNIIALIREILTAKFFGFSIEVDIYLLAFSFISIFTLIFAAGPLQNSFIPLFSDYYYKNKKSAWIFFSKILNLIIILNFIIITTIATILFFKPSFLFIIAPGLEISKIKSLSVFINILLITIPLVSFIMLLTSVLQFFGNFSLPAFSPVLNNMIIIIAILFFHKNLGINSLIFGVILGTFLSVILLGLGVLKYKPLYSLQIILLDSEIKKFLSLALPMMLIIFIDQINALIQKTILTTTGEGNIAILNYAYKLVSIPVGLFGLGISTVIFPTISSLITKSEYELIKDKFMNGLSFIVYALMPITIFFIFFGLPIVRLTFERGAFTYEGSLKTSVALTIYSLGMIGQALIVYFVRIFFAFKNSSIPLIIGIFTAFLHLILCIVLVKYFNYLGIAIATSIYAYIYCILLWIFLFKKYIKLDFLKFFTFLLKIFLASLLSIYISIIIINNLIDYKGSIEILLNLSCYGIIFLIITYIFKINDTKVLLQILKNLINKYYVQQNK